MVDTFMSNIANGVQSCKKGWNVYKTKRKDSKSILNKDIFTGTVLFRGGASASYYVDHSRILTPQIFPPFTSKDKHSLAET